MANSEKKKQFPKHKLNQCDKNNSSEQKENRPKSKKITKADLKDGIAWSKELTKNRINRLARSHDETRVCGNGIPLPSLAELEKLYEDSDEEIISPQTPQEKLTKQSTEVSPPLKPNENKLLSPTTIHKISERLMNMISDLPDPINIFNDEAPPPPVILPKKRKKPEEPYIVGCKDRPRVEHNPNTNVFKGEEEYGILASNTEPESPPHKRAKRSKIPGYSKSIFNAKSDQIAQQLTKNDDNSEELNYASSDSNATIEYIPPSIPSPQQSQFSPLPSTSKDNATFIRNDELFNQSLMENTPKEATAASQTLPNLAANETIVIDDDDDIEIIPIPEPATRPNVVHTILDNNIPHGNIRNLSINLSTQSNHQNKSSDTSDLDVFAHVTCPPNVDVTYINDENDIDDVIAQNLAILNKFKSKNESNTPDISVETAGSTTIQVIAEVTLPVTPNTSIDLTILPTTPGTSASSVTSINAVSTKDSPTKQPATPSQTISHIESSLFSKSFSAAAVEKMVSCVFGGVKDTSGALNPNQFKSEEVQKITQDILNSLGIEFVPDVNQKKTPKTKKSDAPRNMGECPICMDPLASTNAIASTICGHVFCLKCIKAAVKANGKRCPTCRKCFRGAVGYHQLYL